MWLLFALLSAVFAALTSILAKIGIEGVNSNLATAIRTVVVVLMAWGMVFLTHAQGGVAAISRKSWLFLILSGLATGASWLCYYHRQAQRGHHPGSGLCLPPRGGHREIPGRLCPDLRRHPVDGSLRGDMPCPPTLST